MSINLTFRDGVKCKPFLLSTVLELSGTENGRASSTDDDKSVRLEFKLFVFQQEVAARTYFIIGFLTSRQTMMRLEWMLIVTVRLCLCTPDVDCWPWASFIILIVVTYKGDQDVKSPSYTVEIPQKSNTSNCSVKRFKLPVKCCRTRQFFHLFFPPVSLLINN